MSIDYKSSGVDVEAGDQLVDWIKDQKPQGPYQNVLSGVGGFSALFHLDLKKYHDPVIVSCTDGVGTKVRLAATFDDYQSTGIDLVAMCVNDLIVCGADPLFFLDYYASGKLNLTQAQEFLKGVIKGLEQSQCNLIGGETAEMPGHYHGKDYDCAGFCVGAVNKNEIIDGSNLRPNDVAIGISSSGFHSNGFSLLRKLYEKDASEFKDLLLTPTRIYVPLVKELKQKIKIKAMSHITGGGIMGNAARTMPANLALKLQKWPWPDSFLDVKKRSGLTTQQMLETFNCGIGYVFFVSPEDEKTVIDVSKKLQWGALKIGTVIEHKGEACVLGVS